MCLVSTFSHALLEQELSEGPASCAQCTLTTAEQARGRGVLVLEGHHSTLSQALVLPLLSPQ